MGEEARREPLSWEKKNEVGLGRAEGRLGATKPSLDSTSPRGEGEADGFSYQTTILGLVSFFFRLFAFSRAAPAA